MPHLQPLNPENEGENNKTFNIIYCTVKHMSIYYKLELDWVHAFEPIQITLEPNWYR